MLYMTHDQQEALALADRVAVMRAGHRRLALLPDALRLDTGGESAGDRDLPLAGRVVLVDVGAGPTLSVPLRRGRVPEVGEDVTVLLDTDAVHVLEDDRDEDVVGDGRRVARAVGQ